MDKSFQQRSFLDKTMQKTMQCSLSKPIAYIFISRVFVTRSSSPVESVELLLALKNHERIGSRSNELKMIFKISAKRRREINNPQQ
jgi:hypothetical protein